MSLKEKVSEELKIAMKEKNTVKLSILRVLKGEIERNGQGPNGKVDLTDGDIVKIVKKLVEGIKETTNNQDELDVLNSYLPKQMDEFEMRLIINTIKQSGASNVGDFMKYFKTYHDGHYDGKVLSNLVKEVL